MKKSQLKNIIRESIKEIHTTTAMPQMHVYQGCNFSAGGLTGVGNNWGIPPYDGFVVNQSTGGPLSYQQSLVDPTTAGSVDAMLIHNSHIIHNLWNSPNPGQVIKISTCNPNASICQETCLTYIGTTTSLNAGNYVPGTYGMSSGLHNLDPAGPFPSCAACGGGLNPNTVPGCNNLQQYVMQTWAPQQPAQNMPLPVEHFCEWCEENQPTTHQHAPSYQDPMCVCCDSWVTVPSVYGCVDPAATNYDPNATIDDGSCTYPPPPVSCPPNGHKNIAALICDCQPAGDPECIGQWNPATQVYPGVGFNITTGPGFTCNGQECQPGDVGQKFELNTSTPASPFAPGYTLTFELLHVGGPISNINDCVDMVSSSCPTPTPPPPSTPEDPQAKMDIPDMDTSNDEIERMQKLANIS
jgi:hypothetical protein